VLFFVTKYTPIKIKIEEINLIESALSLPILTANKVAKTGCKQRNVLTVLALSTTNANELNK
tara:strand:+ start:1347 stop:1532 length:186 start_codon:yes stop_codon:yes gene_type:complete